MTWTDNTEYLLLEIGDYDTNGWEYKASIPVYYLSLIVAVFGFSMSVFIIIISNKVINKRSKKIKKLSRDIEKVSRGGDSLSRGTDSANDEVETILDGMANKLKETDLKSLPAHQQAILKELLKTVDLLSHPSKVTASEKLVSKLYKYLEVTDAVCFLRKGLYEIQNKQIARTIFDSLKDSVKKKSLPIVVTLGTAFLAKKVANINELNFRISGVSMRLIGMIVNLQGGVGVTKSSLILIAVNLARAGSTGIQIGGSLYFISKVLLYIFKIGGISSIGSIGSHIILMIFMFTADLSSRRVQKYYCDQFVTYLGDSSVEVVRRNPTTNLLPDSSQAIYVQVPSSSFKLFREDAPQCKISLEDVSETLHNFGVEKLKRHLEEQTEICKTQQSFEGEPLSLENFDMEILKGNIDPKTWRMIEKEVYHAEKKLNQMLPDVETSSVEVVKEFPKPTKSVVGQRNLTCEQIEYEKSFDGWVQTLSGDTEGIGPSKMPTSIQEMCLDKSSKSKSASKSKKRKSKSVPLDKRTVYFKNIFNTEKIPEMVEPDKPKMVQGEEADRIQT
jgi:hypothetical protein